MTLESFISRFRWYANGLATRYGGEVWLVGGALRDEDPRDWDVRVILEKADWERCFGPVLEKVAFHATPPPDSAGAEWGRSMWREAYDELKLARQLSASMSCNIDVKFVLAGQAVPECYDVRSGRRLDAATPHFLAAGKPAAKREPKPEPMLSDGAA